MPLSEHEQRQLEQIEQALYREDRKLVRLVRSSDPRVHYRRRVVLAASGFAVGAGMVAAGIVLPLIYLSAAGFAVMLLSGIWALTLWRRVSGPAAPGGRGAGERRSRRRRSRSRRGYGGKVSMMERFDERWRRRQERGGF